MSKKLTKLQMAQFVIHVLILAKSKPKPEHCMVRRFSKLKKEHLSDHYFIALRVLSQVEKKEKKSAKEVNFLMSVPSNPTEY